MAKVISFTLDAASVGQAVSELKKYRTEFEEKCKRFRELIAERVAWSAARGFSSALADDTFLRVPQRAAGNATAKAHVAGIPFRVTKNSMPEPPRNGSRVSVSVTHQGEYSIVFAEGEEALFIEYGAGVYYNTAPGTSPHPWGQQMGYTIGSYGNGNGKKSAWGFYDKNGDILITHGTPAAMPMYRGVSEAIRAIDEIAREVFG